ncbi:TPA: undecaprenyl-diphosphatase [Candidatus Uhrbacteria bacterium]|uniref:Undecaprenyl-diphosphatase n=2 Tax=Candidatus Uhriibacteriota TaxID=1752732 RepID=A0A0G1Q7Q5_9BACT|nr:MAG: Undecaprenyl-diphosphatase [Candidatus Uhrbacteria bacterium GW2011_GWF2_46_218]KKU41039.1 MAG: Undecaprenyl-diphosphatase [Candidatus Uhrbacteria bacterium GW2011_GWE2_46_68]HBK33725.1 undecaprenyl-diphosphatase [Candidatus Uhrbacteria bacterium]HCB19034.1 undecaprenyl-diphosphatase [Candidatus Uhrbacteria bacterium]
MSIFHAFILGLVQGVAEFLPISSSGFLVLVPQWLGWEEQGLSFDAFIHLGTLAAVLIALSGDVRRMCVGMIKKDRVWGGLGWKILIATFPVFLIGFFAQDFVETSLRAKEVVAASFIVWGIVLYASDRWGRKNVTSVEKTGWKQAFVTGCAQVISLIPGTSRSGITISAGLVSGLSRETATRFSFLLGIPAIAAAGGYHLFILVSQGGSVDWVPIMVGWASACISAFFTIKFLLMFLRRAGYAWIAVARVVLGFLILFF